MIPTRVLLVDDEVDFISALAERLRIRDYETRLANSGAAALLEIEKESPDVVLLDLKMPGMSGMETLGKIKAHDPSIEVIMLTGSVDTQVGESALNAGASDHMVKPFGIEALIGKIQDIMKKRDRH
jgi:CheY-like chemotaxis protein